MRAFLRGLALWLCFAGAALAQQPNPAPQVGYGYDFQSSQLPGAVNITDPLEFHHRLGVNSDGSINTQTVAQPCYGRHVNSAANTNPLLLWPGPGTLCALNFTYSGSTTAGYIRLYDTAQPPTCSSATGVVWGIQVPVNSTAANVAGMVAHLPPGGIVFQHGIGVCITGAYSDTDTTNFVTGLTLNVGVRGP